VARCPTADDADAAAKVHNSSEPAGSAAREFPSGQRLAVEQRHGLVETDCFFKNSRHIEEPWYVGEGGQASAEQLVASPDAAALQPPAPATAASRVGS
jgi:hypothetical protein